MSNKKISEFTTVTTSQPTDLFLINRSGTTSTIAMSTLSSAVLNGLDGTTAVNKLSGNFIKKPTSGNTGDVLTLDSTGTWVANALGNTNGSNSVAKCSYINNLANSSTIDKSKYLKVKATRASSTTSTVTIDYSGLPSKYKSLENPFFINNQYVGVEQINDVLAGYLYKIYNHNHTACTFNITTIGGAGAMNNREINLTCIMDNVDNNNSDFYNIKSIYYSEKTLSKIYVNFVNDLYTESKTQNNPTTINNMMILGQGYSHSGHDIIQPVILNRTNNITDANIHHPEQGEGYGATSMGVHVGLFSGSSNGRSIAGIDYFYFSLFA